ncbi:MAG TPA: tannase/feruloyl esterase family alpha/beta hydrolase [Syntrophorhabdaceae bacterium]|nr:tannase/feruloyl esterase family alpha/beta hydrolase [Syntrophorhabdaceae bacterium]
MKATKLAIGFFAVLGLLLTVSALKAAPVPVINCADITGKAFTDLEGNGVTITSAAVITASGVQVCEVKGTILPAINFDLRIPTTTWNERFMMTGSGGTAGSIGVSAMGTYLQKGFAGVATDTGHVTTPPGESWAMPENALTNQKIMDYGYRANHEVANISKKIMASYYGYGPKYSYFSGCSNGGREGLVEAQRYPEDFDGILAGDGPSMFPGRMMGFIWNYNVWGSKVPTSKLCLQSSYVYAKCDALDGLKDGIIENPLACQFDPMTELPACPNDVDAPNCWTTDQRTAIKAIYDGPRTSDGKKIVLGDYNFVLPGIPLGSEVCTDPSKSSTSGWMIYIGSSAGIYGNVLAYMVFRDTSFNAANFNFDTDPAAVMARPEIGWMNAYNPDLSGMKARGHKLLQYESFGAYSPAYLYEYYKTVLGVMHGHYGIDDFYRAYLVPGASHCGGGVGCNPTDWFTPLQNWVENGVAPDSIPGSRNALAYGPAMTRPVCLYPQVARYTGTGDTTNAANFYCSEDFKVRVEPEVINIRSRGDFTVLVTLPYGYSTRHWHLKDVTCQGAVAERIMPIGHRTFIAKFDKRDIQGASPGKATLTVKGTFYSKERESLFEGTDTVKIVSVK